MIGNLICETITGFDWSEFTDQLSIDFGIDDPQPVDPAIIDPEDPVGEMSSGSFMNQLLGNINGQDGAGGIGGLINSDTIAQAQEMFQNGSFDDLANGGSFSDLLEGGNFQDLLGGGNFSDLFEGGEGLQDLLSNGSFFS